jgi:hypothetical protein
MGAYQMEGVFERPLPAWLVARKVSVGQAQQGAEARPPSEARPSEARTPSDGQGRLRGGVRTCVSVRRSVCRNAKLIASAGCVLADEAQDSTSNSSALPPSLSLMSCACEGMWIGYTYNPFVYSIESLGVPSCVTRGSHGLGEEALGPARQHHPLGTLRIEAA